MEREFSLWHAIKAGVALGAFVPPPKYPSEVPALWRQLLSALEGCELNNAISAAGWIRDFAAKPRATFDNETTTRLLATAQAVVDGLSHEAGETLVVKLQRTHVTHHLLNLDQYLPDLTDSHELLRKETIRCLDCGAYRSGIVMAWNLIYDYIRTWLERDATRKQQFDSELAQLMKGRKRKYPEERTVLTAIKRLPGVNHDAVDHLVIKLNQRNTYAHATGREATISMANHYAEELIGIAADNFK